MPAIRSFDRFLRNPPSEYAALANPVPIIFGVVQNEGAFSFIRECINFTPGEFKIQLLILWIRGNEYPMCALLVKTNPLNKNFDIILIQGKTNRFVNDHFTTVFRQNAWGWLGKTSDKTISCIEDEVRKFYCDETRESFPNRVSCDSLRR